MSFSQSKLLAVCRGRAPEESASQAGGAPWDCVGSKKPPQSVVSENQELQKRRKTTQREGNKGEFITFVLLLSSFFPLLGMYYV